MDIREFDALHRPALEHDEARNTILPINLDNALKEEPPHKFRWWSFGAPGACAMHPPGRTVVFGDVTREHCEALAEELAGAHFGGALGNDEAALWFVDRAKALGAEFKEPMPQRIHKISEAPEYPGAEGRARPLTVEDADLFADWFPKFCAEAAPEDNVPSREEMDKTAASGRYLIWEAGGQPVSMAGIVRRTRTGAAIAGVYTPPELRGRGYAGSVTAAVVEKVYAEGRRTACLYTDLRNPASNRCYEKIGFRPVCESWFFLQKTAAE